MTGFSVERDEASAAFFGAAGRGVLLLRHCRGCGAYLQPQARRCQDSGALEWAEASGRATLVSWAVDYALPLCDELAGPDGGSSAFGIVELDEGPWLQVAIVGADPSELTEGRRMRVLFVRPGGGEAVPAFTAD